MPSVGNAFITNYHGLKMVAPINNAAFAIQVNWINFKCVLYVYIIIG